MAVHVRATDRLIGTCAFSQLDADNGSALFHITIGETDAWGQGYGTEATQLMLDHAFGTLGLHRIALFVFEFNVRAVRAYQRCGFVVEGRARESIWRDGRWWDELAMSVLESDWRKRRRATERDSTRGDGERRRADGRGRGRGRAGRGRRVGPAPAGDRARGDDDARAGRRRGAGRGPRAASRRRATRSTTPAPSPIGSTRPSPPATSSGRRRWTSSSRDLMVALEQDDGQKLGGKSAEASRFILRAIDRELDNA